MGVVLALAWVGLATVVAGAGVEVAGGVMARVGSGVPRGVGLAVRLVGPGVGWRAALPTVGRVVRAGAGVGVCVLTAVGSTVGVARGATMTGALCWRATTGGSVIIAITTVWVDGRVGGTGVAEGLTVGLGNSVGTNVSVGVGASVGSGTAAISAASSASACWSMMALPKPNR